MEPWKDSGEPTLTTCRDLYVGVILNITLSCNSRKLFGSEGVIEGSSEDLAGLTNIKNSWYSCSRQNERLRAWWCLSQTGGVFRLFVAALFCGTRFWASVVGMVCVCPLAASRGNVWKLAGASGVFGSRSCSAQARYSTSVLRPNAQKAIDYPT